MALPGAILAQLRDDISVRLATGEDAYGAKVYADAVTVRGRVTTGRTLVQTPGGDQRVEATKVILPDVAGFNADAELTLPDGKAYGVRTFTRRAWPDGRTYHIEVLL